MLNSRRRASRPSLKAATPKAFSQPGLMPALNGKPELNGRPSLEGMKGWLKQLGHSDKDLDGLHVIHVAGTKGKGSTCAFANSFLRAHQERTGFPKKIGLYTSPHLKTVRERIRIDSIPISKPLFTQYFFDVWETLIASSEQKGFERTGGPRYLQLIALLSMHIFIKERVDAAIFETHNGGEYDATNVFQHPVATGITTIGMDHVAQLGPSVENISWHKSGIFKTGVPAFSSGQLSEVATILRQRAVEKETVLDFVGIDPALPLDDPRLKPEAQKVNCSLALRLTKCFLERCAPSDKAALEGSDIFEGVSRFSWAGRYYDIADGANHWFLDGAHNLLSIEKAGQWFAMSVAELPNHTSERDGVAMLKDLITSLHKHGAKIQYAIFSTYEETPDITSEMDKSLKYPDRQSAQQTQQQYAEIYRTTDSAVEISIQPTIEQALAQARKIGDRSGGMRTLITGSLYLVGGALRLLEPDRE